MRALVSGGTRGIGAAICRALEAKGHDVVTFSRTNDGAYRCDVLWPANVDRLMTLAGTGFDILIHNVGGGGRWGEHDPVATSLETWTDVYQKNVGVSIQLTQAILPHMIEHKFGRVIWITSIYSHRAAPRPWFGMAKAAQVAMCRSFAKRPEYARAGVTFNCVAPGHIDTGIAVPMDDSPLGRMGKTSEVAAVVRFLCSPAASLINGHELVVDGGESI